MQSRSVTTLNDPNSDRNEPIAEHYLKAFPGYFSIAWLFVKTKVKDETNYRIMSQYHKRFDKTLRAKLDNSLSPPPAQI